ncbi:MAG: PKD domain-containing protein, partial [Anaerolineae bacterium]|nr:PKD domain-containing protein [Anaerolineae bacterium]
MFQGFANGPDASLQSNIVNMYGNGLTQLFLRWQNEPRTVWGDGNWLYFANKSIEKLEFTNTSGGARYVNMTVWGTNYHSVAPSFGATDDASLTIEGNIDREGSMNRANNQEGTFLWKLGRATTDLDVLAAGDVTFTIENYYPDTTYDVSVDGSIATSFVTDSSGGGSFVINFASQHNVMIDAVGEAPLDDPPTASFVFSPGTPNVGEAITFDASQSSDDNGIVSYEWDFGNGDVAQGMIVTYTYAIEGDYDVTLTVWDGAGNTDLATSPIQVGTAPPPADDTAPAPVTDLEAVVVNSEYVILQWGAPGDDGSIGQASIYDVRFSTAGPVDEVNFWSASPVPVTVQPPALAGSTERLNVSELSPGTEYWFALRAADEVPNWSPVSNSVGVTTPLSEVEVDDTPPAVRITYPGQGAVLRGTVPITIDAVDDSSVVEVVILIDGSLATSLVQAPYAWSWSTATVSPGSHIVRAEATDSSGNVGHDEVQVSVLPPEVVPGTEPPTVESIFYDPT